MSSKLDYLKKYLSASDAKQLQAQAGKGESIKIKNNTKIRKKRKKIRTQPTGFIIGGEAEVEERRDESSDWSDGEGPVVVEFRDESRERLQKMWNPLPANDSPKRVRHDSDSDAEARRDEAADSESDLDVKRRVRHDSNDLTPHTEGESSDSDLEVSRKPCGAGGRGGKRGSRWSREEEGVKLQDGACAMVLESNQQDKTVYRDKHGHKIDTEREDAMKAEKEKEKLERDAKFQIMKSGVVQAKLREERAENFAEEASKDLARYKGDDSLNAHLKAKELIDDPLIQMKSKKSNKKKEQNKRCKPTYQGKFPSNRFNIRPGYRWDGVDRSNGYEKERFQIVNSRKADHDEYYKWSTEDL